MTKHVFLFAGFFFFASLIFAQNKEITVSNTVEFLNAIGSDRVIKMKEGSYDISNIDVGSTEQNDAYYYSDAYDGYELMIRDVKNLTIKGIGKRPSELIAEPQYGNVLTFQGCTNITLENIEAGHGPRKGACTGGVIRILGGKNYSIKNCILYGSGTEGITAKNMTNLVCESTKIHGCTYGIMSFTECNDLVFKNCDLMDNEEYEMINFQEIENVSFENCYFKRNQAKADFMGLFFKITAPKSKIKITNCKFQHNNAKHFAEREADFKMSGNDWTENTFRKGKFQDN